MRLADLAWPAVEQLDRELPVVLPVARFLQHGPHLPLGAERIVLEASLDEVTVPFLLLPTLEGAPGGVDHSHAGGWSLLPETFVHLLRSMIMARTQEGFRRFLVLAFHPDVAGLCRLTLPHAAVLDLAPDDEHAGQGLTALLRLLAPDLVGVPEDERLMGALAELRIPAESGVHGWPTRATTEEGERLLKTVRNRVAAAVEELASPLAFLDVPS